MDKNSFTTEENKYLRRLFSFTVGETDGMDSYATARKVFSGYFDPEFEKEGIIFSGIVPEETKVVAYQLIKDGKFPDFLGTTAKELEMRRLTGSQFLEVFREHPGAWKGYTSFVVLTSGDEPVNSSLSNIFIARVMVYEIGLLDACLCKFNSGGVWDGQGELRIFSK